MMKLNAIEFQFSLKHCVLAEEMDTPSRQTVSQAKSQSSLPEFSMLKLVPCVEWKIKYIY